MWALYTIAGLFSSGYLIKRMLNFYTSFNSLNVVKYKSFEDVVENDEYTLICYRIKTDNGREIVESYLDEETIKMIEETDKIIFIIIEYMFNGNLMKYITYKKDIRFPFYNFKIEPPKFLYYPESIFLNDVNITDYVSPYLGPLCNFYNDREEPVVLKDVLVDHPSYKNFNFNEGLIIMISNDTPLNGKKCIIRKLPCGLLWKRHAAVDPKDDYKLEN
jgi:hypothetical protein